MTVIHHGGVTDGASTSFLLVIPKYKVSIAYATNIDPEGFWRVQGAILSVLKPFLEKQAHKNVQSTAEKNRPNIQLNDKADRPEFANWIDH